MVHPREPGGFSVMEDPCDAPNAASHGIRPVERPGSGHDVDIAGRLVVALELRRRLERQERTQGAARPVADAIADLAAAAAADEPPERPTAEPAGHTAQDAAEDPLRGDLRLSVPRV